MTEAEQALEQSKQDLARTEELAVHVRTMLEQLSQVRRLTDELVTELRTPELATRRAS